jgi:hypothetical protein
MILLQIMDMSNNKQTSVDQLFDQLSSEGLLGLFTFDQMKRALEILDEAKAMHKEEIDISVNIPLRNPVKMD